MSSSDIDIYSDEEDEEQLEVKPFTLPDKIDFNLVLYVDFVDGYIFRQLCEYNKLSVGKAPILFTPDKIVIMETNSDNSITNQSIIDVRELVRYHFDEKRVSHKVSKAHLLNASLSDFRKIFRCVAKKEGIRIFHYEGLPVFNMQLYGGNRNSDGVIEIQIEAWKPRSFDLGKFEHKEPNVKITSAEFCNSCNNVGKMASDGVMKIFPEGMCFNGKTITKVISRSNSWGVVPDKKSYIRCPGDKPIPIPPDLPFFTVQIPQANIKALSKINSFSLNSVIKVFSENDGLCRISTKIGTFGTITIFLKDKTYKTFSTVPIP